MKKNVVIILFSILAAALFLPGGYGDWTDVLIIKGTISVVEPTPAPTPTPALVPPSEAVVPAAYVSDTAAAGTMPVPVEAGLPVNTDNNGGENTGTASQSGTAAEPVQQDGNITVEEGSGDGMEQLGQDDMSGTADSIEEGKGDQEQTAVEETSDNDISPDAVQEDSGSTTSDDIGPSHDAEDVELDGEEPQAEETAEPDAQENVAEDSSSEPDIGKDEEKPADPGVAEDNTSE